MSHSTRAETAFPNPLLAVGYDDGLRYVKYRLNSLAHGSLKRWTESQEMNYTMVVNLKNSQLAKQTPILIQRILKAFGFDTEPVRIAQGDQQAYQFLFHTTTQLEVFRSQLSFFESQNS
jgi:hypothetical protein